MTAETNRDLAAEAAEALLTAIAKEAPTAQNRSSSGLESLANAYAAVVGAMPRPRSQGRAAITS